MDAYTADILDTDSFDFVESPVGPVTPPGGGIPTGREFIGPDVFVLTPQEMQVIVDLSLPQPEGTEGDVFPVEEFGFLFLCRDGASSDSPFGEDGLCIYVGPAPDDMG